VATKIRVHVLEGKVFIKKGEFHSRTGYEGKEREQKCSSTLSLISALDRAVGGQRHAPAALTLGNSSGTHCAGVWMDLKNYPPYNGFSSPGSSSSITSQYTD
jgi:hypothetical protein